MVILQSYKAFVSIAKNLYGFSAPFNLGNPHCNRHIHLIHGYLCNHKKLPSPFLLECQNSNYTPKTCCKSTRYVQVKPYIPLPISLFVFLLACCGWWVFMTGTIIWQRFIELKKFKAAMLGGIVPLSWLSEKSRDANAFMFPMLSGILPLR
ncbi:hypothetical protein Hdeb2414_s0010g00328771 [Helianthus debilis subsp. tardiflorus]